jgi:DDE family transposase
VLAHDFPSCAAGRGIPYGVYDVSHNDGLIVIGTSHDTPRFAVSCIRQWWLRIGRQRYPGAQRLLIEANGGGSNDYRKWEWKIALQEMADEFDLVITVTHYPPGASKWNPIDHQMFSLISSNWRGEPLTSYEVMLKYIRRTRSQDGFHCRACMDTKEYQQGGRVSNEDKARVRLQRRKVLPQWNYDILPHARPRDC